MNYCFSFIGRRRSVSKNNQVKISGRNAVKLGSQKHASE
jgi:hypothetical protein